LGVRCLWGAALASGAEAFILQAAGSVQYRPRCLMNLNVRAVLFRLARTATLLEPAPAPASLPLPALAPAPRPAPAARAREPRRLYLSVRAKFSLAMLCSVAWMVFSIHAAEPWVAQLSGVAGETLAWVVVGGIAILPGFMNAFLVVGLLLDRRPTILPMPRRMPGVTLLVAAYNEQESIALTIGSIAAQHYPGPLQVIVINDGSTDRTAEVLAGISHPWLEVVNLARNGGKAKALNVGLARVRYSLTITIDADSCLYRDALRHLVGRYLSDPLDTRAVAGAILVRNSRTNLVTRAQEWDYFHGIAAVKRLQSLYQGTLVAQGAFSLYETAVLRSIGGWSDTVGEDIVLTWALLARGHRVGFAENACAFTNVPETWKQFIRQRQRWSRGLIEAFKAHWRLLFKARMRTMFIWWNLMFPYTDLAFTLAFLPGLVLALFGIYWIAGPMTLLVLPLGMLVNYQMYRVQSAMFAGEGLKIRRNFSGFFFYSLCYSIVLQPACVVGYLQEMLNHAKRWGTK
jgi:poly-beta-1,6-N-acetyl-D-glucosamine synthase